MTDTQAVSYADTRIPAVLADLERDEAWLARKMKVHKSTVWRVVRKERGITADFVARACAALNMPAEALFVPVDIHMRIREIEHVPA